MNLSYKLRKQKPDRVVLHFPLGTRDPILIDWSVTSTKEAMKMVRTLPWETCEALLGESVLFVVGRDEVDDLYGDDDEDLPAAPRTRQVDVEPTDGVDAWQVSPERWLRLLIQAQQSATAHMETTIKLILETMTENNARAQELLNQSHQQLVSQGDHIERLIDQVAEVHVAEKEEEKENLGEKLEGIVEALSPVLVPLLLKMAEKSSPPQPEPALVPAKGGPQK